MAITLRIQNDNGNTENANTYIDVEWFSEYCEESGYDIASEFAAVVAEGQPAAIDEELIKVHLVRAKKHMDIAHTYKGEAASNDGSSAFPRHDLTDRAGYLVTGIALPMKQAQAEFAWLSKTLPEGLNPNPTRDASGALVTQISERVGPISESKSFAMGGSYVKPTYPVPDGILKAAGYVMTGGTIIRG